MSSSDRTYVLPCNVEPDHVLGLLEAIYSLGDDVDPMYLGDILREQVDRLPHVIDVASSLGLVEVKKGGNIKLTQLGAEIAKGHVQHVKSRLSKVVDSIEPFKTIISALRNRKRLTVDEFMKILTRFYPYNTQEAARTVFQWGAFLGLFKMSPDDRYVQFISKRSADPRSSEVVRAS